MAFVRGKNTTRHSLSSSGAQRQHEWCGSGQMSVNKLEGEDFCIVVQADLDQSPRCEPGYGLVPTRIKTI